MSLSVLGLGSWSLISGFSHNQKRQDSIKTLHAALRGGIRHIDTAQSYDKGLAEQLVGQQLRVLRKEISRQEVQIATKFFLPQDPQSVEKLVQLSLKRMGLSYLDIFYIHWPSSSLEIGPYIEQLDTLRRQGVIKAIGLSNFTPALVKQALQVAPIDYLQFPLSLLWIRSLKALLPLAHQQNILTVGYSPLAMGLLSRPLAPLCANDFRTSRFCFLPEYKKHCQQVFAALEETVTALHYSMADVALKWAMHQGLDIILSGARTKEQLQQTLNATTLSLEKEHLLLLTEAANSLDNCIESQQDNPFFHRY